MSLGRNTKFVEITAIYPDIQIDCNIWRAPFKEGGSNIPEEILLRAGTVYNGEVFYEKYTIMPYSITPYESIINDLIDKLDKHVKEYGKNN